MRQNFEKQKYTVNSQPTSSDLLIKVSENSEGRGMSNKNEKSEDYSKADLKQRVLFFITIFRLAIPAFFRFTDVTEFM